MHLQEPKQLILKKAETSMLMLTSKILWCRRGWHETTSSQSARCTGQYSVDREKNIGSDTTLSTQRMIPTATTGNLETVSIIIKH